MLARKYEIDCAALSRVDVSENVFRIHSSVGSGDKETRKKRRGEEDLCRKLLPSSSIPVNEPRALSKLPSSGFLSPVRTRIDISFVCSGIEQRLRKMAKGIEMMWELVSTGLESKNVEKGVIFTSEDFYND